MSDVLALRDVAKSYRSQGRPVAVLDGVELSLGAGELVWLQGPSGVGKSTLLSVAGLLAVPDRGQVVLGGQDVTRVAGSRAARLRATTIGFVFQEYNLLGHLTAAENVAMPALAPARAATRSACSSRGA